MKDITSLLYEEEAKAWQALARYKFWMFGYHAALWVTLNRLDGTKRPNPFKKLVGIAKKEVGSEKVVQRFPEVFKDD